MIYRTFGTRSLDFLLTIPALWQDDAIVIRTFEDFDTEEQHEIKADYSSQQKQVEQELRRLKAYENFYSNQ